MKKTHEKQVIKPGVKYKKQHTGGGEHDEIPVYFSPAQRISNR